MFTGISGEGGTIKVGGRLGANLGRWEFKRGDADDWRVSAAATDIDDTWFSYIDNVSLVLKVGAGEWRWRGVEQVTVVGNNIVVAGEGRPESRE